jgi:ammonia channel protein AmtB
VTWVVLDTTFGTISLIGACYAAVAGLVAALPSAALVSLPGAMVLGAAAALCCKCVLSRVGVPWFTPAVCCYFEV